MTITLDKPTQRRLEALAKREGKPTEEVAASLVALSLFKKPEADKESTLLRLIAEGLPESFWTRKVMLETKAETFSLSPEEQAERLELLTLMERWEVVRLVAIVELAQLRGETPHQVMQRLGILPV